MTNLARMRNIGAFLKHEVGITAADLGAGTFTSPAAINRVGFESAVLVVNAGAADVADDAIIDAKLQHRADSSEAWSDVTGAAITQITADNVLESVDVDLSGVKAEIQVSMTISFASTGTVVDVAAEVLLGGAIEVPAA